MGLFRKIMLARREYEDRVVRALLEAHKDDCREDRARTDKRFVEVKDEISSFRQDFREFMTMMAQRHDANVKEIGGIKRYVWMGMGAFAVVAVVAETIGGILLKLLVGAGH